MGAADGTGWTANGERPTSGMGLCPQHTSFALDMMVTLTLLGPHVEAYHVHTHNPGYCTHADVQTSDRPSAYSSICSVEER